METGGKARVRMGSQNYGSYINNKLTITFNLVA